jgi:saccharopine dehydrogenase-like NADP-dependent oxidoreductase
MTCEPRVLVVGARGYFGSLLVEELRSLTPLQVVAADRRVLDLGRPDTIAPALEGVSAAICAAGPFQRLPLSLLEACLERRVHYLDLADDRGFVQRARSLVESKGSGPWPAVGIGWSAVPALSALLTKMAAQGLDSIEAVRVQLAPGNRSPRRHGTIASLLSSVGRRFTIWRDGAWREVRGWSAPRAFDFPPPIGKREGYLVDVPDLELFPSLFGCRTVEFRVGSELGFLNHVLSALALLGRDLSPLAPVVRPAAAAFGSLGSSAGAVGVEVTGVVSGRASMRRATVIATEQGQRMPVMPAVATISRLLCDDSGKKGLLPLDAWLTRDELELECGRRGYRLEVS